MFCLQHVTLNVLLGVSMSKKSRLCIPLFMLIIAAFPCLAQEDTWTRKVDMTTPRRSLSASNEVKWQNDEVHAGLYVYLMEIELEDGKMKQFRSMLEVHR